MYDVSMDYLTALENPVHRFRLYGTVGDVNFTGGNLLYNTLTIRNQCSDGDEIKLGSVYGAELNATFTGMNISRNDWRNKVITVYEGLLIDEENDTWEDVPLGVFKISECNHTLRGVEVTAYDAMNNFDIPYINALAKGTPYQWLSYACNECGVTLGVNENAINSMPNGAVVLELYSENDISTFRDLLYWVAQALGAIATINRFGQLEIRQYNQWSVFTVDEYHRFRDCSFSDFSVNYTGMSISNLMLDQTEYVSVDPDDGLVYALGGNPLLQGDDIETLAQNIIDNFSEVALVPFKVSMAGGAMFDLCDCLYFTGGIAGDITCGIMSYTYNFGQSYTIEGYGKNPELASAQSRAEKTAAAAGKAANKKSISYTYTNVDDIMISDGGQAQIIYFSIVSTDNASVVFHAEINHKIATTETLDSQTDTYIEHDCEIQAVYEINGRRQTYQPVFTEYDGEQVLHLAYFFTVQSDSTVELAVILNCNGGSMDIDASQIRAYVSGSTIGAVGEFATERFIGIYDDIRNIITEE